MREGHTYELRKMERSDLAQVLAWRNSERVRINMYTDQLITMEQHFAWFENLQKRSSAIYLVFEVDSLPTGIVNFSQLDKANERCYWGFYLGREDAPRGSGTIMGQLGLKYAFETMGIRKICGEAFAFNEASIKLHLRLGFTQEGILKQHIQKNGVYEDIVQFALFREEYNLRRRSNE